MPVEIKELQIKVVVNQTGGGQSSPSPAGAATTVTSSSRGGNDDLIAECVEQVLNILKQKGER